jgi:hypothetical protein
MDATARQSVHVLPVASRQNLRQGGLTADSSPNEKPPAGATGECPTHTWFGGCGRLAQRQASQLRGEILVTDPVEVPRA